MNRFLTAVAVVVVLGGIASAVYFARSFALVTTAKMVSACESAHHLQHQLDVTRSESGMIFGSCDWPPSPWADKDGYSQITVTTEDGPGVDEASGADEADYIAIPCKTVALAYDFGSQGAFEHLPPIIAHPGDVIGRDGSVPAVLRSKLPTYPSRNEVVYLHNMKLVLVSATCVAGP